MSALRFLPLLLLLASCGEKSKNRDAGASAAAKYELMDADKAFSSLSRLKGMKTAFIEYIDSNGVLLMPGLLPLEGANAIDFLISHDDHDYTFSWKPRGAALSAGGDMGYTYGMYAQQMKDSDSALVGTYVTVWKKQQDGNWKFVLFSANEGGEGRAN